MPDQSLVDQCKAGPDEESAAAMAERLTTAETQLANLTDALAEAQGGKDGLEARVAELTKELEAAKAKAGRASTKAPSEKLRALGPIKEPLERDALREAIAGAGEVEIAFSDGKREVRGLPPRVVSGPVWKDHALGLMLNIPLELTGPTEGNGATIAGYALLLDGKQIAFTPRDPLRLAPAKHYKLEQDIFF